MKRKQIRFISYYVTIGLIVALSLVIAACSSTPASTSALPSTSGLTLSSVTVTPAQPGQYTLEVGAFMQFMATGTYSDGSINDITVKVTWTSSDPTIATVGMQYPGLTTGVAPGKTNVTATLSEVTSKPVILTVVTPALTTTSP